MQTMVSITRNFFAKTFNIIITMRIQLTYCGESKWYSIIFWLCDGLLNQAGSEECNIFSLFFFIDSDMRFMFVLQF